RIDRCIGREILFSQQWDQPLQIVAIGRTTTNIIGTLQRQIGMAIKGKHDLNQHKPHKGLILHQ
ncbi:hypothetical protein, partial [uncultured Alloprevotella sp.]|uniref:hypothetical protein n=1 Tax=uncultured Alloprevotella sp. TaxID=1283315 RepID=UPI00262DBC30